MFEWLIDFSVFGILRIVIFCAIGILIGILIRHYLFRPKNQILYCRERDGRGLELNVGDEDALTLETSTNPAMRFFKYGRSYEFNKRGRAFTRFFGKEGTAYSWRLQGFGGTTKNPKKAKLTFDTLEEAVESRVGEKAYSDFPEDIQEQLRSDKVLLTVELEPGITPKGYEPITEAVIEEKADRDAASLFANAFKDVTSKDLFERLAYIGSGAGLTFVGLLLLGVIG